MKHLLEEQSEDLGNMDMVTQQHPGALNRDAVKERRQKKRQKKWNVKNLRGDAYPSNHHGATKPTQIRKHQQNHQKLHATLHKRRKRSIQENKDAQSSTFLHSPLLRQNLEFGPTGPDFGSDRCPAPIPKNIKNFVGGSAAHRSRQWDTHSSRICECKFHGSSTRLDE